MERVSSGLRVRVIAGLRERMTQDEYRAPVICTI